VTAKKWLREAAGVGYFSPMPIYSDIGISTGAYASFSLAAALLRIAEVAPAAEILSMGRHSLLDAANERVIELSGLPFSVHGPFLHFEYGSRSGREHRRALDAHRRQLDVAGRLGAMVYVVHPDLQRRWKGWDPKVVRTLESSFDDLAVLQEESGVAIAVENLPFVRHSHFRAPGDLDLRGLGLSLDVGHAAVTGTLEQWMRSDHYRLRHVHLHDNEGHVGGDQHLALGRGVVDAAPVLELARAHGATVVLEHKNEADVIESLRHLEERGLLERAVR
jgi:sugar phosphate isomerase/epimerase